MNTISKTLVGTVAAGAMAISAVAPASAQDWRRDRDRGGIDVGDVIAGAVILGGIAAVAGAIGGDNDRYDRDGRYYNNDRYGYNQGHPQQAIEQCVRTAESQAQRRGYRADVTDIRDINRNNRGYTVKGRIAVNQNGRTWRHGQPTYGRGWNNDYRGWNNNLRGYDAGNFTCRIEYGRVTRLDYSGIRGL